MDGLSVAVGTDRVINIYPQAFRSDATPYGRPIFHPLVKKACEKNKRSSNQDLKMSKVVVVGDVAVGKTSVVNRFCRQTFDRDYKATIGVDFEVEQLVILGIPHKLQFWDTAGQERFRSLASAYYRGAEVVIVVFDVDDPGSLLHVEQWMEDACTACGEDAPLRFLVGNKVDLLSDSRCDTVDSNAVEISNRIQAEYWHASARTGENVTELFQRVAALIFEQKVLRILQGRVNSKGSDCETMPREIPSTASIISLQNSANTEKRGIGSCSSCI